MKRKEIFNDFHIGEIHLRKRPKRSTLRLRRYFRIRKICSILLISAIVSNPIDSRFYAKISFLDYTEYGLLDTGASISCIGADFALKDYSKYTNFSKCKSFVKTADGASQKVIGWLNVNVIFKDRTKQLNFFIIPSLSQRLILGIDFWRKFDLIANVIASVDLVEKSCSDTG